MGLTKAHQATREASLSDRIEASTCFDAITGCLLWLKGANNHGYGQIHVGDRDLYAHRVQWELHHGPVPDGLIVRHRCDTPRCVNPDHLELGTMKQNTADQRNRGRMPMGSRKPNAKLTESQVMAIRAHGGSQNEIAAEFGIHQAQVWAILNGKKWKHLPSPPFKRHSSPAGERHHAARLTWVQVENIRAHRGTRAEIAAEFGITRGHVDRIRSRKLWRTQ